MSFIKAFDAQMSALLPDSPDKIAVAVSGGADSLCLTLLLKTWTDQKGISLLAFTVDHRLRPESKQEAHTVHQQLQALGICHKILVWQEEKPKTHVEESARSARYNLLQNACQKNKITFLFLAHHIEDQAETLWARLAHKSGLDGLCAMQEKSKWGDLILMRPLLAFTKKEIVDYLKQKKIPWIEDPMNDNPFYERVKWRSRQPVLSQMGLTPQSVSTLTKRLSRTKEALDFYTDSFIKNSVLLSPVGYAFIGKMAWDMAPLEIRLRTLLRLLPLISGQNKIISLESVEKLLAGTHKSVTLGGCQILFHKKGLFVAREMRPPLPTLTLKAGASAYWDRFFVISPVACRFIYQAPDKRMKELPYIVQKTFPYTRAKNVHYSIDTDSFCGLYFPEVDVLKQKELEKKARLDYNKGKKTIFIHFNPRIQK